MLKLRAENKSATEPTTWPWELTGKEIVQLEEARADLAMKKGAHKRALQKGPKGPSARYDPVIQDASLQERFARQRLDGVKNELRAAVKRRLTPPELLETD